jgi:hypothetical protein
VGSGRSRGAGGGEREKGRICYITYSSTAGMDMDTRMDGLHASMYSINTHLYCFCVETSSCQSLPRFTLARTMDSEKGKGEDTVSKGNIWEMNFELVLQKWSRTKYRTQS